MQEPVRLVDMDSKNVGEMCVVCVAQQFIRFPGHWPAQCMVGVFDSLLLLPYDTVNEISIMIVTNQSPFGITGLMCASVIWNMVCCCWLLTFKSVTRFWSGFVDTMHEDMWEKEVTIPRQAID